MNKIRTFKEFAEIIEKADDNGGFEKFSAEAIKNINSMIEFGRKTAELDNSALNSLLDAIKGIHKGEDVIRKAITPEDPEDKSKAEPKKEW